MFIAILKRFKWHIAGIIGVIALLILAIAMLNRAECQWYGYQTQREVRFGPFIGCMVDINGKWFPRNELRVVQ